MSLSVLDGKYQLEEELGRGSFGVVYLATALGSGEVCAVKVFRPSHGNDTVQSFERFKLEAKSAQKLRHPNIVRVSDSGVSSDGTAYLAMELLNGQSLRALLSERGRLPADDAIAIIVPLCSALSEAHARGVLHRDIKPDNVFLQREGDRQVPKLLDFGVAKLLQPGLSMAPQTLTATGFVIGTPVYMAPERLEDKPYDGKSDVYSLGTVLYEMLTGAAPFSQVGDVFSMIMAQLQEPPQPPRELVPELDRTLEALMLATLAKDPAARPTAAELGAALAAGRLLW